MTAWGARAVAVALLATLGLGVWMRWALAGATSLPAPFEHLRHAHSHLGYFGVLFPLVWAAWRAAGVHPLPGWLLVAYGVATATATAGFVARGYGPVAIAGSTAVAAVWLAGVWPLLARMRRPWDPLGAVPLGLVASLACVPPIALTLRSDPALAHGFVATFLAGLLLVVVVPSAVAASRAGLGPWPVALVAGALGSASLGVSSHAVPRAGLFVYASLLVTLAVRGRLPATLRALWGAVGLGLGALAADWIPNSRPVALGAIHFVVLGPVLHSLAEGRLTRVDARLWWVNHAAAAALGGALVAQGFGAGAWTWTAAAVAGSVVAAWWAVALAREAIGPR